MGGEGKVERATRVAHALGALFEKTRIPVIAVERTGEFVSANEATVAQYGYALEELLEMRIQDLQANGRDIDADLAHAHAGDEPALERRPHRTKDGRIVWVVPTAGPIEVDGAVLVVSVLKDVTAMVSAEERARAARELGRRDRLIVQSAITSMLGQHELQGTLEALVQAFGRATGQAASVWVPSPDAPAVLRMAAAYRGVAGAEEALAGDAVDLGRELVGKRAWETKSALLVHRDETGEGSLERAHTERASARGFVAPLVGRSGTYGLLYGVLAPGDDAEATLSIATALGGFGGVMLEALELERRARLDEQRAELTWQAAVEHLGSAFALLDGDRRIVRVNRALCAFLKRDARDVVGRRCSEVFFVCQGRGPCPHETAVLEGRRIVSEIVGPVSGKPLRVEVWPAVANDTNIASVHVSTDLTEERAARSQLVTADRLATIGRLAAGVAHEVNNPAGFVTLALQLMKDQIAKGRTDEVLAMIDEAIAAMLQINQIMRDLTGFSRERARQPTDLAQVVNSALRIAAHETQGRATVERAFDEGVSANVRGARIAQVVLNLVVNAAQAIPPGDVRGNRIEVKLFKDGDTACIEVTDSGPGVPPALGERIFEPFFTTRESAGGTGLGLWLSRSIIEEEGGTLTFRNVPHGGAAFTIRLPVHRVESMRATHDCA